MKGKTKYGGGNTEKHWSGHKGNGGQTNNKPGNKSHSNGMASGQPHTSTPKGGGGKAAIKQTGFAQNG